ncbi:hypothetical protein [Citreimonas salinaria]|uniref:hypothetical protein n=1 Tax=Citreimonas salinaria TaxID=321339 RepID=UPI0015A6D126|nr:hypothetical protein [Citreimonas salinaria]
MNWFYARRISPRQLLGYNSATLVAGILHDFRDLVRLVRTSHLDVPPGAFVLGWLT